MGILDADTNYVYAGANEGSFHFYNVISGVTVLSRNITINLTETVYSTFSSTSFTLKIT